jgi:hypothetical protein
VLGASAVRIADGAAERYGASAMRSLAFGLLVVLGCTAPVQPGGDRSGSAAQGKGDAHGQEPAAGMPHTVDLGPVPLDAQVSFEVPGGTTAAALVASADGAALRFDELITPSGRAIIEGGRRRGALLASTYEPGAVAVTLRSTDVQGTVAGTWSVRLGAESDGGSGPSRVELALHAVSASDRGDGGRVDLVVHIPGGLTIQGPDAPHALHAPVASDDPCMARRVDAFFDALGKLAGLERGSVRYRALDARFRRVEGKAEREALFSRMTSSDRSEPAVHVALAAREQGQPWGVAAGLPAPPPPALLIRVSARTPARADGLAMVHELGHAVGLRHTTEHGGLLFDSFEGTAKCPHIDTVLTSCPDAENLMFPEFYGAVQAGAEPRLTAGQRRALLSFPFYRTWPDETAP